MIRESAIEFGAATAKLPKEKVMAIFEEAKDIYGLDEIDPLAWSRLPCSWYQYMVFYEANFRAVENMEDRR